MDNSPRMKSHNKEKEDTMVEENELRLKKLAALIRCYSLVITTEERSGHTTS
jgi:hypothetical protein